MLQYYNTCHNCINYKSHKNNLCTLKVYCFEAVKVKMDREGHILGFGATFYYICFFFSLIEEYLSLTLIKKIWNHALWHQECNKNLVYL